MNKRLIAFLSILSLFISLPAIPVNAAAKAGGACSKAGIISIASGKTYTCVKSGKKLVWDKGIPKTKPASSEVPAIKTKCRVQGQIQEINGKKFECRYFSGRNLFYVNVSGDNSAPTESINSSPVNTCKIPDQRTQIGGGGSTGFPMKYNQIKSNGVVKIAVIPITYPNSKTPASVESVFKDAITTIDLRNEYLYGDSVKYDWTLISNWLMMPLNAENFAWDHPTVQADGSRKSDGQAQILTESEQTFHIFSAAEKEININDFDFIWIMSNPLESKVRFSGYGRSKPVRTATTFYPSLNYYGYGYAVLGAEKAFNGGPIGNLAETMAHEMQHFHGMVQHAPGNGWGWFISSNPTWEAWLAGWRKDNEFACFDLAENWKTAEVKLSSMDLNSTGYKSAVIKISNSEALIVESRRKGPYMSNFPKGFAGITVTHLDTTKSGDRWDGNWSKEKEYYLYFLRNKANKYQIYQTRNNAIWDENIIGYEGDSFVYKNVEITLEKSGDYDTIRISKN